MVAKSVAKLNVFIPVPETYPGGLGSVAKSVANPVAKLTGGLCWITFYKKGVSIQDPVLSQCSKDLERVAKYVANSVAKLNVFPASYFPPASLLFKSANCVTQKALIILSHAHYTCNYQLQVWLLAGRAGNRPGFRGGRAQRRFLVRPAQRGTSLS